MAGGMPQFQSLAEDKDAGRTAPPAFVLAPRGHGLSPPTTMVEPFFVACPVIGSVRSAEPSDFFASGADIPASEGDSGFDCPPSGDDTSPSDCNSGADTSPSEPGGGSSLAGGVLLGVRGLEASSNAAAAVPIALGDLSLKVPRRGGGGGVGNSGGGTGDFTTVKVDLPLPLDASMSLSACFFLRLSLCFLLCFSFLSEDALLGILCRSPG
jgi:hypothetical protein